jgi:anti-sigma B factor antagonist
MQVQVVQHDTITVLIADGSLDSLSADSLTQTLDAQIQAGNTRLVVDLKAVHYTSSAGLRSLLMALKGARRVGGDLRLGAAQPNVMEVLSLAGFTSIIKTFDDVQSAIASYAA